LAFFSLINSGLSIASSVQHRCGYRIDEALTIQT
jgi:hypothetical protein